ncbi:MAG TPA: hypothetical protein VFQ91_27660 [Bryobacteraceae bacterium]|nr:hypothetical protein [Bryobacteraceae bacterium]
MPVARNNQHLAAQNGITLRRLLHGNPEVAVLNYRPAAAVQNHGGGPTGHPRLRSGFHDIAKQYAGILKEFPTAQSRLGDDGHGPLLQRRESRFGPGLAKRGAHDKGMGCCVISFRRNVNTRLAAPPQIFQT